MKIQWKKLLLSILIPVTVGIVASFLTRGNMNIYEIINKPYLSPPSWIFPVVWTFLYVLMGISSYFIGITERSEMRDYSLSIYSVQLVFNFFWSLIFFNLKQYYIAFIWLIMLWLLILYTMLLFFRIERKAGYLLLPYLLWVTFAGYLNLMITLLN